MGVARIMSGLRSLCLVSLFSTLVQAISPISVRGRKLYDEDGNQFFVKGVVYAAGQSRLDPLADAKQCATDAALMRDGGVNTIYVYSIDPDQNHDGCMQEFANQGIYVWLNLGDFPRTTDSLQQEPQWTMSQYTWWTLCMGSIAAFDNVLAFGIAQQTISGEANSTVVAPSLKAAARDLRAFREARGYRAIPFSYSAGEEEQFQLLTAEYLTCGDPAETIDIFGLNIFEGCEELDYDKLYTRYRDFHIPLIISESGCADGSGNRAFEEVARTYNPKFQEVFSGANVYEWSEKGDGKGIAQYPNEANLGLPTALAQFSALSSVYASGPTGTPAAAYTPSGSAPACPTADPLLGWLVDGTAALPTIAGLQLSTVSRVTTSTTSNPSGTDTAAPDGQGAGSGDHSGGGSGGLTAGAIAGIVIGCALGVLAVALAVFLVLRRRKRAIHGLDSRHELGSSSGSGKGRFELPAVATAAAEMPGSRTPTEHAWKFPPEGAKELPEEPPARELPAENWGERPTAEFQYELEGSTVEEFTRHNGYTTLR